MDAYWRKKCLRTYVINLLSCRKTWFLITLRKHPEVSNRIRSYTQHGPRKQKCKIEQKKWSSDSTRRNKAQMKTTYPVNQESVTKSIIIINNLLCCHEKLDQSITQPGGPDRVSVVCLMHDSRHNQHQLIKNDISSG